MCLQIYTYKQDLALNNQQWLICHKTQSNQITKKMGIYQIKHWTANLQMLELRCSCFIFTKCNRDKYDSIFFSLLVKKLV